jgi:hypothetical protein
MGADRRPAWGEGRGQSDLLGVVLLLGLVLVGTTAVVTLGSVAIQDTQRSASVANAEAAMTQFDSKTSLVAFDGAESERVTVPRGEGATVEVRESAGSLTVAVVDRETDAVVADRTVPLGAVVYEQGSTAVAYQGGGVWRLRGDDAAMVSPPEFHYRPGTGGEPTLTLPLVTVADGAGGAGGGTAGGALAVTKAAPTDADLLAVGNPLERGRVNVTVRSAYYEAWGRFFEERTASAVTYDHGNETTTVTLVAPRPAATVSNAVVSDAGSTGLANNGEIDSYNSSVGAYAAPGGGEASVAVDGDFAPSNSVVVRGEVHANGDASVDNDIEVTGTTVGGGDSVVSNGPTFRDVYATGGDLASTGAATYESDVVVGGDVTQFQQGTVDGTLHVGGDADLGQNADVTGDLVAGGDVVLRAGARVGGEIHAGGDVTFASGASHADDVVAGGAVTLSSANPMVTGDVTADEEVVLGYRARVDGAVRAGRDADGDGDAVVVGEDAEVTGQAVAGDGVSVHPRGAVGRASPDTSPRPSATPDNPRVPPEPNVVMPPSANATIDARGDVLSSPSENDNAATPAVAARELQGCGSTCTLPAGRYYLDRLRLGSGETLAFDTTGGDVEVYVEGPTRLQNDGKIEVVGDGQVELFLGGDYGMEGQSAVAIPDDRAPQFWLYTKPSNAASFRNNAVFRGVVYGPETDATDGTEITVSNRVTVYGALVGNVAGTSNNNEIHYDRALEGMAVLGESDDLPRVTYLHVSVSNVTVES